MDFPPNIYIAYEAGGQLARYAFSEIMQTSGINIVRGEEPVGNGTIYELMHVPIGDIDLFFNGQRLTRGMDYVLSGKQIIFDVIKTGILRATYNF